MYLSPFFLIIGKRGGKGGGKKSEVLKPSECSSVWGRGGGEGKGENNITPILTLRFMGEKGKKKVFFREGKERKEKGGR